MRALGRMTWVEFKLFLREPVGVFFTIAFPVMVLLLFGSIFGGYPIPGTDLRSIDAQAPAYTGMIIGTVGIIGLPINLASYRQQGVLRRLRATPLHPSVVLASQVLVNLIATALGIVVMLATARLVFDLSLPAAPLSLTLALLLASLAFFAFGFILAGLLPSVRVASAVGQAIFFPMLFLSGAALPREQLPESLHRVSDLIPLTYVAELVQQLWIEGTWNVTALAVLAGVLFASVVVSARTFRWE